MHTKFFFFKSFSCIYMVWLKAKFYWQNCSFNQIHEQWYAICDLFTVNVTLFSYLIIYVLFFLLLVIDLYCLYIYIYIYIFIVANNMHLFYLLKQFYVYLDVHFYESSLNFSYLLNSY